MGEFFREWRRKIGVVTLMMACVFAAGWVRTYSTRDELCAPFGKTTSINVYSFRSNLIFLTYPMAYDFIWRTNPSSDRIMFAWDDPTRTALSFEGFGGGAIDEDPDDPTRECDMWSCPVKLFGCEVYWRSAIKSGRARLGIVIPYWSIAIPLPLI